MYVMIVSETLAITWAPKNRHRFTGEQLSTELLDAIYDRWLTTNGQHWSSIIYYWHWFQSYCVFVSVWSQLACIHRTVNGYQAFVLGHSVRGQARSASKRAKPLRPLSPLWCLCRRRCPQWPPRSFSARALWSRSADGSGCPGRPESRR